VERKSKVKELFFCGDDARIILTNGDSFTKKAEFVKNLGLTEGAEVRIEEDFPKLIYYFGDEILERFDDI